ncbi:MAG: hypothetical protein HN600_13930 [Bacteroidetes bacterium]|jgi:hypothetical protein|nr:hypothetical protein [Bacteroidota bacterium]MBT7827683.1 hypothetical protein [Bacteroidota bacterium]
MGFFDLIKPSANPEKVCATIATGLDQIVDDWHNQFSAIGSGEFDIFITDETTMSWLMGFAFGVCELMHLSDKNQIPGAIASAFRLGISKHYESYEKYSSIFHEPIGNFWDELRNGLDNDGMRSGILIADQFLRDLNQTTPRQILTAEGKMRPFNQKFYFLIENAPQQFFSNEW